MNIIHSITGRQLHDDKNFEMEVLQWVNQEEWLGFYKLIIAVYKSQTRVINALNKAISGHLGDEPNDVWHNAFELALQADALRNVYLRQKVLLLDTRDMLIFYRAMGMVGAMSYFNLANARCLEFLSIAMFLTLCIKNFMIIAEHWLADSNWCDLVNEEARKQGFNIQKPFFGQIYENVFDTDDVFTTDLRKSACTANPDVIPDIDLVYVLSGRGTITGQDADGLDREFDIEDEKWRLAEGIRIAKTVNALRAGKTIEDLEPADYVTPIFYNGRPIHNSALWDAFEAGFIDYPRELFIIREIDPLNTIGQVRSFKNYILKHQLHHKNIAVVSSAYHIPRISKTIGCDSPQTFTEGGLPHPVQELNIFLFGVHKQENRPGMLYDLRGERHAAERYSAGESASISRHQGRNTFFTNTDFQMMRSYMKSVCWSQEKLVVSAYGNTLFQKQCSMPESGQPSSPVPRM